MVPKTCLLTVALNPEVQAGLFAGPGLGTNTYMIQKERRLPASCPHPWTPEALGQDWLIRAYLSALNWFILAFSFRPACFLFCSVVTMFTLSTCCLTSTGADALSL